MAVLINGNGYSPVTAQQDADLYAGLIGQALTVLDIGSNMAATIIDNNTVRIADGEAVCQGRRIHNDPGTYDDFTIPTGSQGVTSYYIIGYRLYTNSDNEEVAATFVQAMSSSTDTITEAVLRDGASETYISFYRVTVTSLAITAVDPLYVVMADAEDQEANYPDFGNYDSYNTYTIPALTTFYEIPINTSGMYRLDLRAESTPTGSGTADIYIGPAGLTSSTFAYSSVEVATIRKNSEVTDILVPLEAGTTGVYVFNDLGVSVRVIWQRIPFYKSNV